jgi:hypothetical protein
MKAAVSPIRSTIPAEGTRGFSLDYLLAMMIGALGVILVFGVILVSLESVGRLPPVQLANNLCIDEKLEFLRSAPTFTPTVLAVGSSVTWRTLDGEAVERAAGGQAKFLNGGFCGLKINEAAFTARYFIARYPTIREVVTILAPQDLTECRTTRPQLFDTVDVDRYVYGGASVFGLYLKYFDPFTFVKNIFIMHSKEVFRWGLTFDRFGTSPIDTKEVRRNLVYGKLEAFDSACFNELRDLAAELHAGGRRLVIATMPLHPEWIQRYDLAHRVTAELERRIGDAITGKSATLWTPGRTFALHQEDFVDAIHIRWSAAKNYSRALVEETGLGRVEVGTGLGSIPIVRN